VIKLVVIFLLGATSAYGMIYSWTDAAGVAHFTNKDYEIPARYRAKAQARYPEANGPAASPVLPQAVQVQPEAIVVQPVKQEPAQQSVDNESQNTANRHMPKKERRIRKSVSADD
jgi:hypothetical protein